MQTLAFIGDFLAPQHMIILLVVGLLFFGHRLPEVGRSLGRGIVEFKKGLKGVDDDIDDPRDRPRRDDRDTRQIDDRRDDRPYRAPLSDRGEDPRVGRGQPVEREPARNFDDQAR
jgi:sec-independent protein translocase protein TatA